MIAPLLVGLIIMGIGMETFVGRFEDATKLTPARVCAGHIGAMGR